MTVPPNPVYSTSCLRCGQPISGQRRGRPRKFCSAACCGLFWMDSRPVPPHAPPPVSCKFCGEGLLQPKVGRPRKFCSITCRVREYTEGVC